MLGISYRFLSAAGPSERLDRSPRRLYLLICLVIVAPWCAPAALAEPGVATDRIVFGQAAALEGPAAALGRDMRDGLLAAFAEANRAGGVRGRKLELISRDDGYEPNKSIQAVRRLIEDDKVFALVGPVGTPTSVATQPIATEAGVPFIGPFTGAEFLRTPDKRNVINVRASYYQETEAMVERLTSDVAVTRIAILYQDDAFGRAGLAGVLRALEQRAMTLVSEATFERNTTAIKRGLLKIRAGNPEAVIMIGPYEPCAAFIKLARQLKLAATLVNISFVGSNALAKALGNDGAGVIVTQVVPFPADTSLPLVVRYQAALTSVDPTLEPGFVSLEGYLVGRLLIAALDKIPGAPTRKTLLAAINDSTFDFDGFRLTYRGSDNQGSNAVYLTMIGENGQFRAITTLKEAVPRKPIGAAGTVRPTSAAAVILP